MDTYIDVDLPYPDAKVEAALCIGGACKYVLKENCGIADDWLLEHVVPSYSFSVLTWCSIDAGKATSLGGF